MMDENVDEAVRKGELFGAVAYHVCPNCMQEVERDHEEDPEWKKEVGTWIAKERKRLERLRILTPKK